jgi:hypothetical protein
LFIGPRGNLLSLTTAHKVSGIDSAFLLNKLIAHQRTGRIRQQGQLIQMLLALPAAEVISAQSD